MSFVRYNPDDFTVSTETVIRPMWSGDNNTLTTFFTASAITSSFYVNVYGEAQGTGTSTTSSVQFCTQYGNKYGSGSQYINSSVTSDLSDGSALTYSRVVYGQYRTMLLGTEYGSFDFGAESPNGIYIINIARNRYKEHINPGSLTLKLKVGAAEVVLTDNSQTTAAGNYTTGGNLYYTLISGSGGAAYATNANASVYGYLFPHNSIIVINPTALFKSVANGGIDYNPTISAPGTNDHMNYAVTALVSASAGFTLQSSENVASQYFFTRVKNQEFNYTTNPSIIDSNGNILYSTLINNPQTFVTTVGLYNDNNDLLAVAKLSKPLVKDFTKEALLKIKLQN